MLKYSIKNRCSKNTYLKAVKSQLASTVKKLKLQYEQSPVTGNCYNLKFPIQCNVLPEIQG